MVKCGNSQVIRPAGLLERFHITRHFLGFDSCVISAAQYIVPENFGLNKETVVLALREVVETHAALGIRLTGESTNQPSFFRLGGFDLAQVVETSDSDDLQNVFESQFGRPFDTTADIPLWRVIVMKNNYVCFAWHHCIGDGLSSLAFHRTLLMSLRKTAYDNVGSYVLIPSTTTLVPAIETVTDLSPSWRKVFKVLYNLFAPTFFTRGASAWTGNRVRKNASLKTHVRLIDIPPNEAKDFLALCRSNHATLTSAYQILAITVLSKLITADSGSKFKTISSIVPISLRSAAGTPENALCDHVSTVHVYPPIKSTFSWADASAFASFLHSSVLKSREEVGMLKFLFGQYTKYFKSKLGKKREIGLEISNLGRFNIGESGGETAWSIGGMAFAQCDCVTGPALKLNCVGNLIGGVTITVTWGDDCVADSFGDLFVSNFKEKLTELVKAA